MKFAVTGGAGLIGSALVSKLLADGHDVLVLDSFQYTYCPRLIATHVNDISHRVDMLLQGAQLERCNLMDKSLLADHIAEFRPDVVVHLAAIPLVGVAQRHIDEARRTMIDGLINILDVVRSVGGVGRFVFASSSMVYGHFTENPMPECGLKQPLNIYGGLKYAGEVLAQSFLRSESTECTIVRPSAVYGPTDQHRRVVQVFCENALIGQTLTVNDGTDMVMDFTFVEDIARGFALAATHDAAGDEAFNITYGEGRSLFELVEIIQRHIPSIHVEVRKVCDKSRPRRGALSVEKAGILLGYTPSWSLEQGVPAYLEHLTQQFGRIAKVAE